jgi:hypothetical protein
MDDLIPIHERCSQPPAVTAYFHSFEFLLLGLGYILEALHIFQGRFRFSAIPELVAHVCFSSKQSQYNVLWHVIDKFVFFFVQRAQFYTRRRTRTLTSKYTALTQSAFGFSGSHAKWVDTTSGRLKEYVIPELVWPGLHMETITNQSQKVRGSPFYYDDLLVYNRGVEGSS